MGKKNVKKKLIRKKIKKIKKKKVYIENKNINENEKDKDNEKNEDNLCIICLCHYDNDFHKVKTLKCNHTLCENCFNQWYKVKESCPICRRNLFPYPSDRPDFYDIVSDLYLHHDSYFSKQY